MDSASKDFSRDDRVPITFFHTNDLQSRLLGFGPNADYTPGSIGDDNTKGGVARLMTLLEQRRAGIASNGMELTLDGGDVMMGTLFHTISREMGTEFQLLKLMEYDAITLGNHDFDFRPEGLGSALSAAVSGLGVPPIVLSNISYDSESIDDDLLEEHSRNQIIKPSTLIEKSGVRFGVIGVMGYHAISVIGEAEPITFLDPIVSIKTQVAKLKDAGADVVVLLSHSGVYLKDGQWAGDDIDFAKAVPELDLIISGHSHLTTPQPVKIKKTLIVQAGSEGRFLGELKTHWSPIDKQLTLESYTLHEVDDQFRGDERANKIIEEAADTVNQLVLAPIGLTFDKPIAEVDRTLGRGYHEHTLGNIAAESLRRAAKADLAITTNGEVRAELQSGTSGMQQVSDIFRIFPIGIGYKDDSLGYDLVKVYFSGREIKNIMEVLLFAYKIKGPSFYPRIAGMEIHYNPNRVPLDQITDIYLAAENSKLDAIDLSSDNEDLYSVTMTHYAFKFLSIVGELSYGLLEANPKQAAGLPVEKLEDILVDSVPEEKGIQKQKAWSALIAHLQSMPDTNANMIPNITSDGGYTSVPRLVSSPSYSPGSMLRNSSYITKTVFIVIAIFLVLSLLIVRSLFRKWI